MATVNRVRIKKVKREKGKVQTVVAYKGRVGRASTMPLISLRGYALESKAVKKMYIEVQQDLEETRKKITQTT